METPPEIIYRQALAGRVDWSLPLETRAHPLRAFRRLNARLFLKREDETGFAAGGSKIRKYASLLPFLEANLFDEVFVIGGAFSNNALGISSLLRERGVGFRLFLRGEPGEDRLKGNHLWLRLFVEARQICWVPRAEWAGVRALAETEAETRRAEGRKVFILDEGASAPPALPGCATFWPDVLRNEQALRLPFHHVVMDAGTGMTAAVAALAQAYWGEESRRIHVLQMAEDEAAFVRQLEYWRAAMTRWLGAEVPVPQNVRAYPPEDMFGRAKRAHLETILRVAREEGVLADPVYTARLFARAERLVADERLSGNILLVHSGGLSALSGFQEELRQLVEAADNA